MPSPLGSFLLTLSTESQYGVVCDGLPTKQIFVSDNAKMMRMTSCASYSSSNDSDPAVAVAAINVARKVETKPTNWDRLCSPISERRAVQQTLSLPRRKLSQDNIASMAMQQRAARRSQSMSLTNKRNELLQRKVVSSEDDKYASASTQNATFSIPQKGKINPFTAIFPTPCKAKDLSTRPLECPQRKLSVDNMSSILKARTSTGTTSNQGNASFDAESLKCHGKRALLNPFKTLMEPLTKQESITKKTVNIEQIPMPISPLASRTNKLHLKSALKTTCSTHSRKTKSVTILSLADHLQNKSHPESVIAAQVMMGFQQQEQEHHQQDPSVRKDGKARRLGETVVTLQKCSIDVHERSKRYGPLRSLNGKAA
jgi:hypothetical protein